MTVIGGEVMLAALDGRLVALIEYYPSMWTLWRPSYDEMLHLHRTYGVGA